MLRKNELITSILETITDDEIVFIMELEHQIKEDFGNYLNSLSDDEVIEKLESVGYSKNFLREFSCVK